MDQDAFRSMLSSSSKTATARFTKKQPKTISASEPAFKPRKVKKDEKYRDRAAERRVGQGNDFEQVEALLDDFNESTANDDKHSVEAKRRYLGGDSEHTVLVKGLDFALLEQNKAKAAISATADEDLEEAFEAPKKRTKQDILRELKEKRVKEAADLLPSNKFKPIGFKPVQEKQKKKKKAVQKRKLESPETVPSSSSAPAPQTAQEPEPVDDLDFDIFQGAGEYGGLDVSDDDGSDADRTRQDTLEDASLGAPIRPGRWFDEPSMSPDPVQHRPLSPRVPLPTEDDGDSDSEDGHPMRLVPLEGSSVPSIKELLALDQAASSTGKKRKRKGKKEGTEDAKQAIAAFKAEKDYKKFKSYQDKKAASTK